MQATSTDGLHQRKEQSTSKAQRGLNHHVAAQLRGNNSYKQLPYVGTITSLAEVGLSGCHSGAGDNAYMYMHHDNDDCIS